MTRSEREQIRKAIDEAARNRIRNEESERASYWRNYYQKNRARILDRKATKTRTR